jgi:hypothetical protein
MNLPSPRTRELPRTGAIGARAETKYLGYLSRSRDGAATNMEKEPLGVLIASIGFSRDVMTAGTRDSMSRCHWYAGGAWKPPTTVAMCLATSMAVRSSRYGATIWMPAGNPAVVTPTGATTAGRWATPIACSQEN